MSGELKVAIGVHDLSSIAMTRKHAVDASTNKQGDLTVELRTVTGEPIRFEGKQVYITEKGARLMAQWRSNDRTDEGLEMKVYRESLSSQIGDKFWGLKEEDR